MPTERVYAQPQRGHVSLGTSLRALLFLIPVIILGLVLYLALRPVTEARVIAAAVPEVVFAILWAILVSGVRVAAQWERGVVLRLGKFLTVRGPGIMINPSNPLVSMVKVKESRWNRYRLWKPLSLMVVAGLTPREWAVLAGDVAGQLWSRRNRERLSEYC